MHGIDVSFMKKQSGGGDDWWEDDLIYCTKLTGMAGLEVPGEVLIQRWPPKTISNGPACGIETPVAELVVGFAKQVQSILVKQDELVMASPDMPKESATFNKELACILSE